jgi:acyl transferase domain-containing protein
MDVLSTLPKSTILKLFFISPSAHWQTCHRTLGITPGPTGRSHASAKLIAFGNIIVWTYYLNESEPRWRAFLRISDNPWVCDHQIQSSVLSPAAGFITMAIEAAYQIADKDKAVQEFEFRNIQIGQAAVVSDDALGLECILQFRPHKRETQNVPTSWYEFTVSTCAEGQELQENCSGMVAIRYAITENTASINLERDLEHQKIADRYRTMRTSCQSNKIPESFYKSLSELGLKYEPSRTWSRFIEERKEAAARLQLTDTAALMPEQIEYSHILHPAPLDGVFQTAFSVALDISSKNPLYRYPSMGNEITGKRFRSLQLPGDSSMSTKSAG